MDKAQTTKLSDDAIALFRRLDNMIDREGEWMCGEKMAIEQIQKVLDKWKGKKK